MYKKCSNLQRHSIKNILPILLFICGSCTQPFGQKNTSYENSLKTKENELLKKELALKEKELEISKKELEDSKNKDFPISELYKQVKPGVFLIYTQSPDSIISQGTGFFLNTTGVAISNYHVFENADRAIVILDNKEKYLINEIIDANKDLDYIIFRVENQSNKSYPLQISKEMPEIGSTCFAVGNPIGLTQTCSIGNISGYRYENKLIQTTAEITHGSSGGPLFNKYGQVIGITSSGFGEANLNFAINISIVHLPENLYSDEGVTVKEETVPIEMIKSTISNYYTTVYQKDYITLNNLYTPILDRFFSNFNIPSSQAVDNAKRYWTQFNIVSASNKINWETLNISKSSDGTFYVTFNMDYYIQRAESSKDKSFNMNIIMTITKDMKIKSIYENILHKK
jgi:serine protease Do